jgi:hypothetical protein
VKISAACLFTSWTQEHKIGSIQTSGICSKIELNRNDVTKWTAVFRGTFLCLNIEKANDMITDPRKPIRTSPAPGLEGAFVR